MITNTSEPRKAGRPRVMQDDEMFRAVYRVLTGQGPGHLTLAAVAEELGCSAPALLKRFGSRRGLLLASAEWSLRFSREMFSNARRDHDSPLAALRACLLLPEAPGTQEIVGARGLANALQFYFEEAVDPDFRSLWGQWIEDYERETIRFLKEAVAAGELVARCDPARLGRTLHAAMSGVGVLWVTDQRRSSKERLREAFDSILEPYLPA